MAENTVLDVLIAELLGDVGKLHDEVKSLETRLPEVLGQVENKLSAVASRIEDAGNRQQKLISQAGDQFRAELAERMGAFALTGGASKPAQQGGQQVTMTPEIRRGIIEVIAPVIKLEIGNAFDAAKDEIREAAKSVRSSKTGLFITACAGGFAGVLFGLVVGSYVTAPAPEQGAQAGQYSTPGGTIKPDQRRR